jgi:glutathione S-transferase
MTDLTLYHAAPSRSSLVRWMLEELGEPYEVEVLVLSKGEHLTEDYKAINPMAKVPALRHRNVVVTEAAAICTYLADELPDRGLNVPIGDPLRGPYLKWLFFGPSCIEPAMMDSAFPRKEAPHRGTIGYGDLALVMDVVSQALAGGPYLLGDRFTAADVVVGSTLRFGIAFKLLPERPEVMAYIGRLLERPAMQRTLALDEELASS